MLNRANAIDESLELGSGGRRIDQSHLWASGVLGFKRLKLIAVESIFVL